jgi:hypothetical protein
MNIERLLGQGCSDTWIALLRDWDRFLRAGNHPETTRSNYLLAARQLADYLAEEMPRAGGPVTLRWSSGGRSWRSRHGWSKHARPRPV